jgi:hypothetical protein
MSLFHEDELLDERHVVGLALPQYGPHARYLLRLVVVVVQIATILVSQRLLIDRSMYKEDE